MNRARRPPPLISPDIRNPIQQPPHSAGTPLHGLRTKLDPAQIPSAPDLSYHDEEKWMKESYLTVGDQVVPLSDSIYHAIDQGNSTPRFLRPTVYAVPSSSELQSMTHVPFGVHISPFAQQNDEEEPVPVVDLGETGPPRCTDPECKAYINPWCGWEAGGLKWICNLCGMANEAPIGYTSSSDTNDHPELRKGTVDFLVPSQYWAPVPPKRLIHAFVPVTIENDESSASRKSGESKAPQLPNESISTATRKPGPMNCVFALDVSYEAVQSGFLTSACKIILDILYGGGVSQPSHEDEEDDVEVSEPDPQIFSTWKHGGKVAIITFDRELCFYDLSPERQQASIMVMPDIDEVFPPMPPSSTIFADPAESRHIIELLLRGLPTSYGGTLCPQAALGSAVAASLSLLSSTGGRILAFGSCLPKVGLGMLADRENESQIQNTDNEPTLFKPRDNFWKELAEECVDCGVGVSLVLAPSRWIDVATLGIVPSITGGELLFHARYHSLRDQLLLASQIRRIFERETGYQVATKLRCTTGIQVKAHYGNFLERSITDIQFGILDADKSIYASLDFTSTLDSLGAMTMDTISSLLAQTRIQSFQSQNEGSPALLEHQKQKHRQALSTQKQAYFQSATLYTTVEGERRVRVCNLSLPVVSLAGNVYRYGDCEAVTAALAKTAMSQLVKRPLREIRDSLTAQCAELLLNYRRYCAAANAAAQLILPEGFTLLPVYTNCILKTRPLKGNFVVSDVRNQHALWILSRSVRSIMRYLYPRLYQLHEASETMGTYDEETGRLEMPAMLRSNHTWMQGHGVYLIDDGLVMILWLGADVDEAYWQALFGVSSAHALNPAPPRLPDLDNDFSIRVRTLIAELERQTRCRRSFVIVRQNLDGLEIEFANMLMEDTNNDSMSYLDCMCFHVSIHQVTHSSIYLDGILTANCYFSLSPVDLCYIHRLITASLDNGYTAITVGNSSSKKIPW